MSRDRLQVARATVRMFASPKQISSGRHLVWRSAVVLKRHDQALTQPVTPWHQTIRTLCTGPKLTCVPLERLSSDEQLKYWMSSGGE